MPKFHVKNTFTVEGRPHFVLAGTIMEGTIRPGMVGVRSLPLEPDDDGSNRLY